MYIAWQRYFTKKAGFTLISYSAPGDTLTFRSFGGWSLRHHEIAHSSWNFVRGRVVTVQGTVAAPFPPPLFGSNDKGKGPAEQPDQALRPDSGKTTTTITIDAPPKAKHGVVQTAVDFVRGRPIPAKKKSMTFSEDGPEPSSHGLKKKVSGFFNRNDGKGKQKAEVLAPPLPHRPIAGALGNVGPEPTSYEISGPVGTHEPSQESASDAGPSYPPPPTRQDSSSPADVSSGEISQPFPPPRSSSLGALSQAPARSRNRDRD